MRDDCQAETMDDPIWDVRRWVAARTGIEFSEQQLDVLRGRLETLGRSLDLSLDQIRRALHGGDSEVSLRVAASVSTNHTFFFREPEILEHFGKVALPTLSRTSPRIWSAAASSGDEAYSLAIAALESLGEVAACRVRILATDLSRTVLAEAARGAYGEDHLSLVSPQRRESFFTVEGQRFVVRSALKEMCTFRRLNLLETPYPFTQRFHVVFLRNVLYYFDPRVRRRVLEACYDAAEPGAFLYTSLTEPMVDLTTRWSPVAPAVFRKEAR